MWRQICVCNNRQFLCRGKPVSVIDHGTHQPQSIIYWYKGNSGKALWHRSTIDCSWCSFRMWQVATMVSSGCHHGIINMRLLKPCRQELSWTIWEIQKLALTMSWRSPHILSVHVMNRRPIHPTQCIEPATKYWYHALGERGSLPPSILPKLK